MWLTELRNLIFEWLLWWHALLCDAPSLLNMPMLKSVLINQNVQTCHLIGLKHSCQPIQSYVKGTLDNWHRFQLGFLLSNHQPQNRIYVTLLVGESSIIINPTLILLKAVLCRSTYFMSDWRPALEAYLGTDCAVADRWAVLSWN